MSDTFGSCLRQYRRAAALTQELLAERAGISPAGVAALEAGRRRTPRLSTVLLLVEALDLDEPDRQALIAAASDGPPAVSEQRGDLDVSVAVADAGSRSADIAVPSADPERHAGQTEPYVAVDQRYEFVGRPGELQRLAAAWEGSTRVVLVAGEAGVGKTRLVKQFASTLSASGLPVLWGCCTAERLGSYEPFLEPLRAIVQMGAGNALKHRGELARLLPELSREAEPMTLPTTAEPAVERRILFEAVSASFSDLGRTLLILDDVQWADTASMALLDFLAASPGLRDTLIVATVRSTDVTTEQAAKLSGLRRRGAFERINLGGLGFGDLSTLVEQIAGDASSPQLIAAVADATEGNPLFIEELTEHLLDRGFESARFLTAVPEGVRDTLMHRIAGLSGDAQALLRTGSVLGREFDPQVAGELAGLARTHLIAACEDALLSGLINEASASALSFSHALVRSAVYESVSSFRRLEMHRQAAMHLEAAEPPDTKAIVDLLRHWSVVAASDRSAAGSAAHWALRAGDAAAAAAAMDEAIAFYQQAVDFSTAASAARAEALVRLGVALSNSGRPADADETFRTALGVAEAVDEPTLYARAALGLSSPVRYGHSDPERVAVIETAIARLGPDEVVLRPALLTMLVRQLGFDPTPGAYERRQEAAALVLAAVSDPDASEELIIALGSNRDSIPLDEPAPLGIFAKRVIEVAQARRDLPAQANGWYGKAWSALELGDAVGWQQAIAAYASIAGQLQMPYERHLSAVMAATAALIEGRYEQADKSAREALAQGELLGRENAGAVYLTNAVLCGIDQGHAEVMLSLMLAAQDDYANVQTFVSGLTLTAAHAGDFELTKRLLDEQGAAQFRDIRRDAEWLPVIGFLCSATVALGDREHAQSLHDLLLTSSAATVRVGPLAGWWGAVDHHLGSLDRVLGRLDDAGTRLDSALAIEAAMGAKPFVARTQLELAHVLDLRGRSTDVARAAWFRTAAAAAAEELGAVGIVSEALAAM